MMMAIMAGKKGQTSRGDSGPPASIAGKYTAPGDGAPEDKGKAHQGGKWDHEKKPKKDKKKLKKALEDFIKSEKRRGAGCLVVDKQGKILLGRRSDNGLWTTPGGGVEAGETYAEGAMRELKEESGITAKDCTEIHSSTNRGVDSKTFLVRDYKGKLKGNGELLNLHFMEAHEIPWGQLTDYACEAICNFISEQLKKSKNLKLMLAQEDLQKNIMRGGKNSFIEYDVTHGDALKIVGNGTFRMLREAVSDMPDEGFKEVLLDHYKLHIRKHINDVYSGRVTDGHKQIHQFANKSLPQVAVELMSVFEWYLPEDEGELEILDESSLNDDAIEGGLNALIERYRQHNIVNIYSEMENIRKEIRNGMAVDLQQVEHKIMKLFDKLENTVLDTADKHNILVSDAGSAIDDLESKLIALQDKVEKLNSTPTTVQAYSPSPSIGSAVHSNSYPYLSKPTVTISPDGKISITFASDWTHMERADFLQDMKAKVISKKGG